LLLETIAKAEGARASKRRLARLRADLAQLDKALEASAAELERARAAAKGTK